MSRAKKAIQNVEILERVKQIFETIKTEYPRYFEIAGLYPLPTFRLSYVRKARFHGLIDYCYDFNKNILLKVEIIIRKDIIERKSWEYFDAVVRHEIAHYFDIIDKGHHGHGTSFYDWCEKLGGTPKGEKLDNSRFNMETITLLKGE